MNDIGDIQIYSPRWQCMVMLFAVLNEVRGGLAKMESISRIRERRWFDFQPEDSLPYPANRLTNHEPRWITVIAWARKDGVEQHLMPRLPRNNWDLNGAGMDVFASIARVCRDNRIDIRRCYLWSRTFKLHMYPSYPPDSKELTRPINLYQGDWVLRNIDFLLAQARNDRNA